MPYVYDDSGGVYEPQVIKWAYTPDELYEETNFSICKCYRPKMYNDGYDRCIGTKEIDVCSCSGDKRKCDFYD